jgi:hypothetical protein
MCQCLEKFNYQYIKQELIIMIDTIQNQPKTDEQQPAKMLWQVPYLDKITLAETESGPFTPNAESGACAPS